MKRIDELIPAAIAAIKENHIPVKDNGIVPNEYKGYIDTFGASIVQNGLIPAVIFFETAGGKEDESITSDPEKKGIYENRNKMMKAILQVILQRKKDTTTGKQGTLYDYITTEKKAGKAEKQVRQEVVDAAIAIKVALRTFAFKKENEND
jgi:CRISPR-associated protein Cmr5